MTEKEIELVEKLSKRIIWSSPVPLVFAYIYLSINGEVDSWYNSLFLKLFLSSGVLIFVFLSVLPLFIKYLKKKHNGKKAGEN